MIKFSGILKSPYGEEKSRRHLNRVRMYNFASTVKNREIALKRGTHYLDLMLRATGRAGPFPSNCSNLSATTTVGQSGGMFNVR